MTYLIYFILGMFTTLFIIPFLENFLAYIVGFFEVGRAKQEEKVTLLGLEIKKKMNEADDSPISQIGFVVDTENDQEEEDDENDDL